MWKQLCILMMNAICNILWYISIIVHKRSLNCRHWHRLEHRWFCQMLYLPLDTQYKWFWSNIWDGLWIYWKLAALQKYPLILAIQGKRIRVRVVLIVIFQIGVLYIVYGVISQDAFLEYWDQNLLSLLCILFWMPSMLMKHSHIWKFLSGTWWDNGFWNTSESLIVMMMKRSTVTMYMTYDVLYF